jgi:hypothetical protein
MNSSRVMLPKSCPLACTVVVREPSFGIGDRTTDVLPTPTQSGSGEIETENGGATGGYRDGTGGGCGHRKSADVEPDGDDGDDVESPQAADESNITASSKRGVTSSTRFAVNSTTAFARAVVLRRYGDDPLFVPG